MSRTTILAMCLLAWSTTTASGAATKAGTRRVPQLVDNPVTVGTLGDRIEKFWDEEVQPVINKGSYPKDVNTCIVSIMWKDGQYLAKSFQITKHKVLDMKRGFVEGMMYLIRHDDTQYLGLIKANGQWRSFAMALKGDTLGGDTGKPAPAAHVQKVLTTFITDSQKVGIYFSPWFLKISLPNMGA